MLDEKFLKREDETLEEYQLRLSVMKLKDGEDIEWQDIKELLNSDEHRDTLRRKGKGLVMAYDIYEEKIAKLEDEYYYKLKKMKEKVDEEIEDKRLKEINNKVNQLQKEKQKLKDERNHINAERRIVARVEHLIECTKDEIEELNKTKPLLGNVDLVNTVSEKEGVVLLSDIHYGAETDNILDCYNPQICEKKLNYYCKKVIEYGELNNLSTIHMLGLGDFISGLIHNVNRFDSRLLITEQVIKISELIAEFINELSKHFYVKYAIINGNHSRIVAEKDNSREEENFTEFIRPFIINRLAENKNVEYINHKDCGIIEVDVLGNKCLAIHGDNDRDRNLDRLIQMYDYPIDYIFRGHFHQSKQFDVNNTTVVCSGAFGSEGYAKKGRLYNKPIQKFLVFNKEGMICSYDINLNNYKK